MADWVPFYSSIQRFETPFGPRALPQSFEELSLAGAVSMQPWRLSTEPGPAAHASTPPTPARRQTPRAGSSSYSQAVTGTKEVTLTRDELQGLLDNPQLLADAAHVCNLPTAEEPASYLVGCIVRRQAAVQRPDQALFSLARIERIWREARPSQPNSHYWRLALTPWPGNVTEPPTCLAYVSNNLSEPCHPRHVQISLPPLPKLMAAMRCTPDLASRLESASSVDALHRTYAMRSPWHGHPAHIHGKSMRREAHRQPLGPPLRLT